MADDYKNIREPAVAGQFYSGDESRLDYDINKYLKQATAPDKAGDIRAIMVPHAGYDFSAPVAAYAYKRLEGKKVNTVVIISNAHAAYFTGIALDPDDAWRTPLGLVPVDKALSEKLVNASPDINYNATAHASDHTLEVQLPFLQTVLASNFKIVPILYGGIGKNDYEELAKLLYDNLGPDDLVIVSSDMSHYPAYADANRVDSGTLERVKSLDTEALTAYVDQVESERVANEETLLCGIDAVKTVMALAKRAGWQAEIMKYANSGDTKSGDKTRVVGYGAVVFNQSIETRQGASQADVSKPTDTGDLGQRSETTAIMLNIARTTVETYIKEGKMPDFKITDERLNRKEGAFVTLHENGDLRGCIGQIVPSDQPLWQVVRDMAIAAATEDHRFNPVSQTELEKIDYEVSVLSVPKPIDDWKKIELGMHGVIVKKGLFNTGVFLPQVADETGWTREEFLSELCSQKAGLERDCYKDKDVTLEVFTAQVLSENELK